MRWAGHVAGMMDRRDAYRVLVGRPAGRNRLEDQDVNGRIAIKWIIETGWGRMDWVDVE
jgi:hypothetical protein